MKKLNIKTVSENKTGRNTTFNVNGQIKNRIETVKVIEQNPDSNYHVRVINGKKTPVSNPDKSKKNNLD